MDSKITEKESLQVIYEMIETSKANLRGNSFFYLLWGWLVLLASLSHFALLQINYEHAYLPWPILMFSGGIVSGIAGYKLGKKTSTRTHTDTTMIYLWYGFMVTLLIVLVFSGFEYIHWKNTSPLIILLYALATFVSGGTLKFKPLIWGAIASWIIAIIAFIVTYEYVLLLTALSIIVTYLIPGYMLKHKENGTV